ncbi:putative calcium transporting P-type ATPase [Geopyxis carbonaria]|nr:putative calcium transporting P-type ATPase [Geopyxis carbonaria]
MPIPSPPKLEITTAEGDQATQYSPQSATTFVASPSSPTASARRPSEAGTLLPVYNTHSQLSPAQSSHSQKTYLDAEQSRSRSSSVAGASMLSGDTARPETPYNGGVVADTNLLVQQLNEPYPGTEADFKVDNNPFAFNPGQLNKFLNPKNLDAYHAVGGIRGLEKGLRTDLQAGLSMDEGPLDGCVTFENAVSVARMKASGAQHHQAVDGVARTSSDLTETPAPKAQLGSFSDRIRVFNNNTLPTKSAKSIWRLMWEQYNDKILILLTVAAVVSLALGLYESLGVEHAPGSPPPVDWIEGVAICVAIIIVVLVGSLNDWQKERQFVKLNAKKEDRLIKGIRSGKSVEISVHDLLVGDVLHLEPGDMIPTDGIFISGHNVKCDESSATGESDQMKKTPGEEVFRQLESGTASQKLDPFLISGSKVLEGVGTFMVTSTGVNSSYGKLMMSLHVEVEATPLQVKLGKLADAIAYLGGGAAALLFTVLFLRWCAGLPNNDLPPAEKGSQFLDILIVAITLIVVAIPEGLPLAVTLALAFATTRMLKEKNLVRVLRACETMGNATTVCSDKTGTLTQNKMTVVAGTISKDAKFSSGENDSELPPRELVATFSDSVKYLLLQSIAINSTAFEGEEDGKPTYIGSKTETAMLTFARDFLGLAFLQSERDTAQIVQMIPFDSGRKCMGVVVKLANGVYRLYVKGASEILLAKASSYITDVTAKEMEISQLTEKDIRGLDDTINSYAERSLRTIAMLYKDYTQWPPVGARTLEDDATQADFDDVFNQMVFLGIVGIQDPLRPGVTEAVAQCKMAGVKVRMVTGDNVVTARAIATECGIFTEGGVVMEGPNFRRLSEEEMNDVLPRLEVLARSSPEDKKILVARLKALDETVAVTGDGTNDGPALKMADVGFSMGIAGTEVAKEASSIILMDDNFASIIKALMWGRAVNDAVQKFLQFQLTVNITAVLVTFVSAVSSSEGKSVLTAVQLLWVNLIMDTFAALALATDAPTPEILNRKPAGKKASLVTLNMWKMIIGQAIFQLAVTYVLYFAGPQIFTQWAKEDKVMDTVVFNTFVWMQIFNEFNNRRLDNKFNVFEGVTRNYFFMGINCIMVGGQVMIVFIGKTAFSIVPLNGPQWALCVIVAAFSLPWAMVVRSVPDPFVGRMWGHCMSFFGPPVMKVVGVFQAIGRLFPTRKIKAVTESLDDITPDGGKGKNIEV